MRTGWDVHFRELALTRIPVKITTPSLHFSSSTLFLICGPAGSTFTGKCLSCTLSAGDLIIGDTLREELTGCWILAVDELLPGVQKGAPELKPPDSLCAVFRGLRIRRERGSVPFSSFDYGSCEWMRKEQILRGDDRKKSRSLAALGMTERKAKAKAKEKAKAKAGRSLRSG
ncbi:MAG TPA: hypothetical protein VFW30_03095 [Bryocella sp.]|nr:hypothetical protein [Bryocella sp.]